jgi:hypothetical protein
MEILQDEEFSFLCPHRIAHLKLVARIYITPATGMPNEEIRDFKQACSANFWSGFRSGAEV